MKRWIMDKKAMIDAINDLTDVVLLILEHLDLEVHKQESKFKLVKKTGNKRSK
jgi:hypothetical protein